MSWDVHAQDLPSTASYLDALFGQGIFRDLGERHVAQRPVEMVKRLGLWGHPDGDDIGIRFIVNGDVRMDGNVSRLGLSH